jgi:hypothetical protein
MPRDRDARKPGPRLYLSPAKYNLAVFFHKAIGRMVKQVEDRF